MVKINKKPLVVSLVIIVVLALYLTGNKSETTRLTFATAGTGGTYYPMGGGIANLFTEKVDGIEVTAQTSGGSAENLRLIQSGDVDMAWANGSEIYWAANGKKFFKGKSHDKIRIVSFAWTNTYHFASLKNSSIKTVKDFEGKKVGVGPQGSGAAIFAQTFLEQVGMWNKITPMFLPPADQTTSLKDKNIDVFGYFSGVPMASMIDISSVKDIELIDLEKTGREKQFTKKYPFYIKNNIPANTYKGQEEDVSTYSNLTYWVVSADMSEEVVYELAKKLFSEEGLKYMKSVHKRSNELAVESIVNGVKEIGVPLHPGMVKFLEEQGIKASEI